MTQGLPGCRASSRLEDLFSEMVLNDRPHNDDMVGEIPQSLLRSPGTQSSLSKKIYTQEVVFNGCISLMVSCDTKLSS